MEIMQKIDLVDNKSKNVGLVQTSDWYKRRTVQTSDSTNVGQYKRRTVQTSDQYKRQTGTNVGLRKKNI